MPLREDIDGLRWTGLVRGEGRVHLPSFVGSIFGVSAATAAGGATIAVVGLAVFARAVSDVGWVDALGALVLLVGWMMAVGLLGLLFARSLLTLVSYEMEVAIEERGVVLRLIAPLPWEALFSRINWPGHWREFSYLAPWEELDAVQVTSDWGRAAEPVAGTLVLTGPRGEHTFHLVDASSHEVSALRVATSNAHRVALLGQRTRPPEAWSILRHPSSGIPWRETGTNLRKLQMKGLGAPPTSLPRGDSIGTVEKLRRKLGR